LINLDRRGLTLIAAGGILILVVLFVLALGGIAGGPASAAPTPTRPSDTSTPLPSGTPAPSDTAAPTLTQTLAATLTATASPVPTLNPADAYRLVNASTVLGPGQATGLDAFTATCPANTKVLSGGFLVVDGTFDILWRASYPKDASTWSVMAMNPTAASRRIEVYAVCAHDPSGYEIQGANTTLGSGQPTGPNGLEAACPAGKKVTGGGFLSLDGVFDVRWWANFPGDSQKWSVMAFNPAGSARRIAAFATCASDPAGYETDKADLSLAAVQRPGEYLVAACPDGKKVLGGGFNVLDGTADVLWRASYAVDRQAWGLIAGSTSFQPRRIQVLAACAADSFFQ
jgi:hypothetical protein